MYNHKFSEVDVLRKGRSGAYSQKETYQRYSQIEGTIKAILVTH